ncbi:hypothetical protein AC249_AIPGENE22676 [Exaiptasia diaphana]|nr:hypothetical protein AC249_AIPGENE22676 [Exaiptasia diaphana]
MADALFSESTDACIIAYSTVVSLRWKGTATFQDGPDFDVDHMCLELTRRRADFGHLHIMRSVDIPEVLVEDVVVGDVAAFGKLEVGAMMIGGVEAASMDLVFADDVEVAFAVDSKISED